MGERDREREGGKEGRWEEREKEGQREKHWCMCS